ncbi:MAG TPA: Ig-like domain-containing protein [Candidatus Bathyarchaeia archaeon]|nr:Ig-like domain-containing protein [Candidatus Bathyarchaeia archaeon]
MGDKLACLPKYRKEWCFMKRLYGRMLLGVLIFSLFQPYLSFHPAQAADPEPDLRLIPVADKFVDYGTGTVYGDGDTIPIEGSSDRYKLVVGYLHDEYAESVMKAAVRYDLKDVDRSISSATLTIPVHAVTPSSDDSFPFLSVYGSSDDTWDETSMAMPDGEEPLSTINLTTEDINRVKSIDVTNFVKRQMNAADKKVSFLITGPETGTKYSYFNFFDRYKGIEDKMARLEIVYNLNSPPTDILLSPTNIPENSPAGTTVGTLTTIDTDSGDSPTFTIIAGDMSSFTISSGNQLKTTQEFDYEAKNNYNLTIEAIDSGGNSFSKPFAISVTNQNEAPAGSLIINSGDVATASSAVTLTIAAADPESDSIQMRFSNDATTWDEWTEYTSNTSWTLPGGDGVKTVYMQLQDAVGNNSVPFSDSIILDTAGPIVTGVENGASYNTDQTISFTEGSATLDGHQFVSGTTVSEEGTHTLIVTDQIGNTTTVQFTIDKTAPIGTVTINSGKTHTNDLDVTLAVSPGDASFMRFTNDPDNWDENPWVNAVSEVPWTFEEGDGTKTVYMQLRDALGNVSGSYSDTIELDTAAPVVTGVADGESYNTDVTIFFNEGTAKLGNADFANETKVSAEGSHTLRVTDEAGNLTTIHFTIDKSPPQGTLSINNGATRTGSASVTLDITSSDAFGDVEMRLSSDDINWTVWEPVVTPKAWRLVGGNGNKTVYLELRDAAGNLSKFTANIRLDVYQPPPYYPVSGVLLDKHTMNIQVDETDILQATIEPANATNKQVRWSSSDPTVAEVDDSGKVTAKKPGRATITVTTLDGQKTDRCEVTVKEEASFRLEASDSSIQLNKGESARFQIYLIEGEKRKEITNNKDTDYSVDNDLISVKPGQITAGKQEGESVITVSYQGVEITIQVTVKKESVRLQASKSSFWLKPNAYTRIKVYAYDGKKRMEITNDKDTSYELDNELITLKAGRITAGDDEGESLVTVRYQGEEILIPVTISKMMVRSLTASPKQAILEWEEEQQLELTATYNDKSSKEVTNEAHWTSSDTDVVVVSENGELTAIGNGTAVVKGAYGNREVNIRILVIKEKTPKKLRVNRTSVTISAENTIAIEATAVYEKGYSEEVTSEVEWESEDPDIAMLDDGEIIGIAAGSTKITGSYLGKKVTIKVTVRK